MKVYIIDPRMLCKAPKIERNLYQIQLLDSSGRVRLVKNNLTESPFQDPEIFPSSRVGRWEGESKLETYYYELDYMQSYQLMLMSDSCERCYATIELNDAIVTKKLIFPRQTVTLTSNSFRCHPSDLIEITFSQEASNDEVGQTRYLIRFLARHVPEQVIDRINFRGYYPFG